MRHDTCLHSWFSAGVTISFSNLVRLSKLSLYLSQSSKIVSENLIPPSSWAHFAFMTINLTDRYTDRCACVSACVSALSCHIYCWSKTTKSQSSCVTAVKLELTVHLLYFTLFTEAWQFKKDLMKILQIVRCISTHTMAVSLKPVFSHCQSIYVWHPFHLDVYFPSLMYSH